jgi:tetratricopeptide (TPR) repeat protein
VRVCLAGKACGAREAWGSAVLLVQDVGLSGAVHVEAEGCRAPVGKRGGVLFRRVNATPTANPAARSRPDRAKARRLVREGAAWLSEGNFEKARRQFLDAIAVDATIPEAYNGVGVTYRMRDDLPRALDWYKKALAVDPDFGDAYYNMACVYALQGSKDLSLRYLQIAAMNGYATAHGMDEDPDLERVRGEPGYRALVKARM